jgi:hypothetical protein
VTRRRRRKTRRRRRRRRRRRKLWDEFSVFTISTLLNNISVIDCSAKSLYQ